MTKKTKIQKLKLFIKASIIIGVLFVFVVLGIFMQPARTFENANMKKWTSLTEEQRLYTVEHIVKSMPDKDLLM